MATERTPEERARDVEARDRAAILVAQARQNLTSWVVADRLDLPADACEGWVNAIWNGLRSYDTDDLIQAIVCLIEDDCMDDANETLTALDDLETNLDNLE